MAQYAERTFEKILSEAKAIISDDIQKGEGSLVHNALAACAVEIENLYVQIDYLIDQSHADTADYEHLIMKGKDRGLTPIEATYGIYKGKFNVPVKIGNRFNFKQYNYVVVSALEDEEKYTYLLMCETAGSKPNGLLGELTMIDHVDDLTDMRLTEQVTAARDYETKEEYLKRYYASFSNMAYGGNVADYKSIFSDNTKNYYISGISACKVHPVWNGGGSVKLVLLGDDYAPISESFKKQLQSKICPVPYMGYGIAPIGHDTTVESASAVPITITTTITYETGYDWSDISALTTSRIEDYLLDIRKQWDNTDKSTSTVYISRIEATIIEIAGVVDISDTTINGKNENLKLDVDQVPMLQTITVL